MHKLDLKFEVRILMMEQNVHPRTLEWGIQHYNQHEQNEDYHLMIMVTRKR